MIDVPVSNPATIGRVYAILQRAGRPVTRGELRMYDSTVGRAKAAELQVALDTLVSAGYAAAATETDPRRPGRAMTTYRLLPKAEGGAA